MDTHDVSNSERYLQVLQTQQKNLKAADARRGECPTNRKSRGELVDGFRLQLIMRDMQRFRTGEDRNMEIHSSFVPPPYPPSITPLKDLKQIFISDLKLGIHHCGSYLLARCITPPSRMTAIMAIVEDEKENATILQLYQQDTKNRPDTSILDSGVVLVIKEPFFKVMSDGEYGLRVDHVSDVVYISSYDEMRPQKWAAGSRSQEKTALEWKTAGNAAMKSQQYWLAIQR